MENKVIGSADGRIRTKALHVYWELFYLTGAGVGAQRSVFNPLSTLIWGIMSKKRQEEKLAERGDLNAS